MRECTRLGCGRPASHEVRPAYGRPWFGCPEHYAQMSDALSIGGAQSDFARVTPLELTPPADPWSPADARAAARVARKARP